MKKFVQASLALAALGLSAPAVAADMAARPIARPVAFTNWTGCYVGGGAGSSVGTGSGYSATPASTFGVLPGALPVPQGQLSSKFGMTGATGGFYGGCQAQFGVWVLGAEGDWFLNNKEGQSGLASAPLFAVFNPITLWSAKERWYSTARARLGYAVDKWLFYVTGGAAWMKIDSAEFVLTVPGAGAATLATCGPLRCANLQSDTRSGWTIGGGVEYALPYNWTIRSEYLYIRIPSYTTFTPGIGNGIVLAGMPTNLNVDLQNHIFRAGLAYKFDFGKAVPAVTK
jgi:outer membrane immunogenic protein